VRMWKETLVTVSFKLGLPSQHKGTNVTSEDLSKRNRNIPNKKQEW